MSRPKIVPLKRARAPKKIALPWMRDFVAEADTSHLSRCDFGSHRKLLRKYWNDQQPLPDDDEALARIAGCSLAEWRGSVRRVLEEFFIVGGGVWRHLELDAELMAALKISRKRSAMAREAARRRWERVRAEREKDQLSLALPGAAKRERDLMEQARAVLGEGVLARDGGKWRLRCRRAPEEVRRVLEEVSMQLRLPNRRTGPIRAVGGYAEDVWKQFQRPKGSGFVVGA